MIQAIETQYKGYRFRSRLEARWAIFFDALDIEWQYEPEGFVLADGTHYLPDFWLPQVRMWAEVKGQDFTPAEQAKCRQLAAGAGHPCLMLNGMPDGRNFWAYEPSGELLDYVPGEGNQYWLSEGRFFVSTGEGDFSQIGPDSPHYYFDVSPDAIAAARGARFEHGESGGGR